jgi:nitrous oxidase accessory protein NosD
VVIGPGSANITISNSHIHHFKAEPPKRSYGIEVHTGTHDISLIRNHVHHNTNGSIKVIAEDPAQRIENLQIVDNKIHDDHGSAIDVSAVRGARIATNKIYNYRPGGQYNGAAITIGPDVFKAAIEENHIAEATIGIEVGAGSTGEGNGDRIQHVFVHRNYMENRLTADSTGIVAESGRGIHVFNNIVDHYATGLRLRGGRSQRAGTAVANNVFIEPTLAFDAVQIADMRVFDSNIFSISTGLPAGQVGSEKKELAGLIADGTMPKTQLVKGADLLNRDLAHISGLTLVDAGSAQEGVVARGSAPDIGVAEK